MQNYFFVFKVEMYMMRKEIVLPALLANTNIRCENTISLHTPESFNTNILYQLFYYKITFVNSQHENTNSEGDFVSYKTDLKISGIQKII